MSSEPNEAVGEYIRALEAEIYRVGEEMNRVGEEMNRLHLQLERERSKIRIISAEEETAQATAQTREKVRGWLAGALVVTLIAVIGVTFGYLVMLSRNFADLTMEQTVSVIPMVGTTLLTPLVGLVGAVTGFYFGGQAAAQATQETHHATMTAMQMGMDAGKSADQSTIPPQ